MTSIYKAKNSLRSKNRTFSGLRHLQGSLTVHMIVYLCLSGNSHAMARVLLCSNEFVCLELVTIVESLGLQKFCVCKRIAP